LLFNHNKFNDSMEDIEKVIELNNRYTPAYYLRALIEEKKEEYYKALFSVDKVIEIDSNYPLIYEYRGILNFHRMGNLKTAELDFKKALEHNSFTFQTPLNLGSILSESDVDTAFNLFTNAIKLEPENPLAYQLRAYLNLNEYEDVEAALKDFAQAINLRQRKNLPFEPQLVLHYASALLKTGEIDKAIYNLEMLRKIKNLSISDRQSCLTSLGAAYSELNRHEESVAMFDEVVQIAPQSPSAYFSRGLAHRVNGNAEKSIEDLSKAIELKGNDFDPICHFERALSYLKLNDTQSAIKDLDTAILLEGQFVEAYNQKANIFIAEKRYTEAIDSLNKVIELDPEDGSAFIQRGQLYIYLGEKSKALSDFGNAINLEPHNPSFYLYRARAYAELYQDVRKTFADINKAINLDSKNADAYVFRGQCQKAMLNDDVKAQADFDAAISVDPNHSEAYYERGMLFYEQEKFEEALKDFNKSIEIETEDSRYYAARALILSLHKKDSDGALNDCDYSLKYDPDNTEALNLKALILTFFSKKAQEALQLLNLSISIDESQVLPYSIRAYIYNNYIPDAEAYRADMEYLKQRAENIPDLLEKFQEFSAKV
jgi:tetratricopeptide (TPR) repeat protein